jgi:hypothetical protein
MAKLRLCICTLLRLNHPKFQDEGLELSGEILLIKNSVMLNPCAISQLFEDARLFLGLLSHNVKSLDKP